MIENQPNDNSAALGNKLESSAFISSKPIVAVIKAIGKASEIIMTISHRISALIRFLLAPRATQIEKRRCFFKGAR